MNPGWQQVLGWFLIGCGAIIGTFGGILVKDAREALRSAKESVHQSIEEANQDHQQGLKAQVIIVRAMDDFESYLRKALEAHSKEIDHIAQEMNYRNLYSSGPHIGAQFDLANKHREEIRNQWINFQRNIQDTLLASNKTELPDSQLKKRYAVIQQETKNTIDQIGNLTSQYFKNRSATFPQADLAEKELLKPVSLKESNEKILN